MRQRERGGDKKSQANASKSYVRYHAPIAASSASLQVSGPCQGAQLCQANRKEAYTPLLLSAQTEIIRVIVSLSSHQDLLMNSDQHKHSILTGLSFIFNFFLIKKRQSLTSDKVVYNQY